MASTLDTVAGTGEEHATRPSVRSWAVILAGAFVTVAATAWLARRHLESVWDFGQPAHYERTVIPHAIAMTSVIGLVLLVAVPLLRARVAVVAVMVCAAASVGPLSLLAAPIFTTPASYEIGTRPHEVAFPWLVGTLVTVLLLIAAHSLNRGEPHATPPGMIELALLGALMASPLLVIPYLPGRESNYAFPTFFPIAQLVIITGWAVLAGGLMAVGLLAVDRPRTSALRLAVTATSLGLGHWAYDRDGGAPIVPGWDNIESPHLIAAPTTVLLIAAAAIGLSLHTTGVRAHLARSRAGHPV